MKIEDCRIRQHVQDQNGRDATVAVIYDNGTVYVDYGPGSYHHVPLDAASLTPVSDPCQELEAVRLKAFWEGRAAERKDSEEKISQIVANRDAWKATAKQHCRNATYWRKELEKMQKEALAEYRPLGDVAKIYIQISPAVLAQIIAEREE